MALATDRLDRVKAALAQMPAVEASKARRHSKPESPARVSTTDPDARNMKMPNGGFKDKHGSEQPGDRASFSEATKTKTG